MHLCPRATFFSRLQREEDILSVVPGVALRLPPATFFSRLQREEMRRSSLHHKPRTAHCSPLTASRSAAVDQVQDGGGQFVWFDGFGKVQLITGSQGAVAVFDGRVAGQGNRGNERRQC